MGMRSAILCERNAVKKSVELNRFFMVMFSIVFLVTSSILIINTGAGSSPTNSRGDASDPEIELLKIEANIDNNYAITEITESFRNPNNYSIDETFTFQIPNKAFISNFSLTIGNDTYYAQIVSKEEGKQKYNEAVINGSDAGLVEAKDKNIFSYSVSLSAYQELIVGLRYEQFLEKALGGYQYFIPLSELDSTRAISEFLIDISIKSKLLVTDVQLENYRNEAKIDFVSAREARVTYSTVHSAPNEDFIINYELATPPINGTLLNYNDGVNEFFMHIFSPQKAELGGQAMAKDIIFVLDKSGSMSGEKISQLKSAFGEIIDQLRIVDSFNIIMFDSTIKKYETQLVGASSENKTDAEAYIDSISAGGSTNINDALESALDMFQISETKVPIIVMLTDGLPTAGTTNTQSIRENIKNKNTAGVSIFCLGFGFDVDFEFLKAMSLENYGIAIRIYEGEDASEQITDFYDTISTPLLKGLLFTYSKGTYEFYPDKVDQLFEGAEVVVVGKYNGTKDHITVEVEGTSWNGWRTFIETFKLEDNSSFDFIPRFWAYAKIQSLLEKIAVAGQNESFVENVTNLALEYGFVTPYTSLLVEITEPESESESETDPDKKEPEDKDSDGDGVPDSNSGGNTSTFPSIIPRPGMMPPPDNTDPDDDNDGSTDSDGDLIPDADEPNHKTNGGDNDDPDLKPAPPLDGDGADRDSPDPFGPDESEKEDAGSEDETRLNLMAFSVLPILILIIIILSVFGYSKIKRNRLLQQKRREMIYKHIHENPGEHFRGIQKSLGLEVGVVAYHINKLEREEFVKSRQDGQKRRFYPMDAKIDVKLILSQIQERIFNWIKNHPGSSGSHIADNLGVNRKVVNYHVKILQSAGFIYVEKQGRETLCYSTAGV